MRMARESVERTLKGFTKGRLWSSKGMLKVDASTMVYCPWYVCYVLPLFVAREHCFILLLDLEVGEQDLYFLNLQYNYPNCGLNMRQVHKQHGHGDRLEPSACSRFCLIEDCRICKITQRDSQVATLPSKKKDMDSRIKARKDVVFMFMFSSSPAASLGHPFRESGWLFILREQAIPANPTMVRQIPNHQPAAHRSSNQNSFYKYTLLHLIGVMKHWQNGRAHLLPSLKRPQEEPLPCAQLYCSRSSHE